MLATWGCTTFPKPTLSLDFLGATSLDSRITFSRGSQATLFDSTGTLVYAKHNLRTYSSDISTTNSYSVVNTTLTSVSVSTPISGVTTATLVTLNVGANTGNSNDGFNFGAGVSLTTSVQYTQSLIVKAAGTTTFRLRSNVDGGVYNFVLSGAGTAPTPSGGLQAATISALSDGWYRVTWTFTATGSAPGNRGDFWALKTDVADGVLGVYVTGAQLNATNMEGGVTSSLTTYYPTTTAAYYAPRFDYDPSTLQSRGLLIEEQRTNSIRNNTMQGAVAGTPGTLPTNWTQGNLASGLSPSIIGTGTSNGINYIDIRISGTTADTLGWSINHEPTNQIAASSGQVWTASVYVAIIGGSTANITQGFVRLVERNSAGGYITESNTSWTGATSVLSNNRFAVTRTLGATAAFVQSGVYFQANSGVAIDITLRIGLPQLEQGAFATSVIPTTTTALTRNADVATMTGTNFSSWYNQAEGSFVAQVLFGANVATQTGIITAYESANPTSNRVSVRIGNTLITSSGSQVASFNSAASANALGKWAVAYKTNDFAQVVNAGTPLTDTSGSAPTSINELEIGGVEGLTSLQLNGHIQRIAYYPTRLPNTTLQALTA